MLRLSRDPLVLCITSIDSEDYSRILRCMDSSKRSYEEGNIDAAWCLLLAAAEEISFNEGRSQADFEISEKDKQRVHGSVGGRKRARRAEGKYTNVYKAILKSNEEHPFRTQRDMKDKAFELAADMHGKDMDGPWFHRLLKLHPSDLNALYESLHPKSRASTQAR